MKKQHFLLNAVKTTDILDKMCYPRAEVTHEPN